MNRVAGIGLLMSIAATCVAALPAHAAFPGRNGDIVFTGLQQSPFGFFVPFPATVGSSGIYVTSPDGTEIRPIKFTPKSSAAPESEGFGSPKWSPDGATVAYTHVSENTARIEVMSPDGSDSRPIGPAGIWGPTWSPDGSMIAFMKVDQPRGIYVMSSDGANPRLLVPEGSGWDESPAWSPDCSRVAFTAYGEVWTMRADGRVHVLSSGFEPEWSPDGRKFAYWTYGDGGPQVFVAGADGRDARRLKAGATPAWSPDGTRIVFSRWGGLATMNPDGSDVRTVTAADNTVQWHLEPNWQPLTDDPPKAGLCDAWGTGLTPPQLRVSVKPRIAPPNVPTRFRFKVTRDGPRPVRRAVIYFAGRQTRTDARGRAVIKLELPHNVRRRAVATKGGFRHDTATVRTPPES